MSAAPPTPGDTGGWQRLAEALMASAGVHRPSTFSAALAALLPDVTGRTVVDAGSGAGLLAIAALARGAAHVVAMDHDPAALADTRRNAVAVLGAPATRRLSLLEADWSALRLLCCDVVVANPPQRPTRLLRAVLEREHHLHVGGGADGLDGIRAILRAATASAVVTTASSLLDPAPAALQVGHYARPELVAVADVVHDAGWRQLTDDLCRPVNIWRYARAPQG